MNLIFGLRRTTEYVGRRQTVGNDETVPEHSATCGNFNVGEGGKYGPCIVHEFINNL